MKFLSTTLFCQRSLLSVSLLSCWNVAYPRRHNYRLRVGVHNLAPNGDVGG